MIWKKLEFTCRTCTGAAVSPPTSHSLVWKWRSPGQEHGQSPWWGDRQLTCGLWLFPLHLHGLDFLYLCVLHLTSEVKSGTILDFQVKYDSRKGSYIWIWCIEQQLRLLLLASFNSFKTPCSLIPNLWTCSFFWECFLFQSLHYLYKFMTFGIGIIQSSQEKHVCSIIYWKELWLWWIQMILMIGSFWRFGMDLQDGGLGESLYIKHQLNTSSKASWVVNFPNSGRLSFPLTDPVALDLWWLCA